LGRALRFWQLEWFRKQPAQGADKNRPVRVSHYHARTPAKFEEDLPTRTTWRRRSIGASTHCDLDDLRIARGNRTEDGDALGANAQTK